MVDMAIVNLPVNMGAGRRGRRGARRLGALALAVIGASTLSACATVQSPGFAMRDGGVALPPVGWLDFCDRNMGDPSCRIVLTEDTRTPQKAPVKVSLR